MQRLLALALLAALLPAMAIVAVIVAMHSRRWPLVAHRRVGRDGRPFWMWKFRTMWDSPVYVEDHGLPPPKGIADARVSGAFAHWLRRHSIDELPQLWHVVAGEMALVGPRPLTRQELEVYYRGATREILAVRPGMTGLWQVAGRSRLSYAQRLRLDLFLVRHRCVRLTMRILWRTVPQVLRGADAW
jgi:exopolysaccharide production protein ExoY